MKRTYLFGTMMAFGLAAASVGAQQDRPTASSSDQHGRNVVVTGCLKSGSQLAASAASGTAGTTGTSGTTASDDSSFILTDARMAVGTGADSGTGTAASTAATTGTSGSTAPDADKMKAKAKSFALIGGTPSELQGYVNSKVEITGTIDPSASGSATTTTGSTATGTTGAAGSMVGMSHTADQAKLRVTSVKQLAASCDAGQQ